MTNKPISNNKYTYVYPIPTDISVSDPKYSNLDAKKTTLNNGKILSFCTMISERRTTDIKKANASGSTVNPLGYAIDNGYVWISYDSMNFTSP